MIALITFSAPAPSGASRTNSALVVAGTCRAPLSTTAVAATIPPATAAITALGTWTRFLSGSRVKRAGIRRSTKTNTTSDSVSTRNWASARSGAPSTMNSPPTP